MTGNGPGSGRRMVEHLVAPVGPELSCDECFEALDAYVELELAGIAAGVEMPLMRAHLRGCSACRDDHDSLLALVRADGPYRKRA